MNDFQPIDEASLAETIGDPKASQRSAFPSTVRIGRYELQDVSSAASRPTRSGALAPWDDWSKRKLYDD